MPQTPATPGGEQMSRPSAQTSNWCVEKIEVKVVSGEYIDRAGVVVALVGSDCKVMCLYATPDASVHQSDRGRVRVVDRGRV